MSGGDSISIIPFYTSKYVKWTVHLQSGDTSAGHCKLVKLSKAPPAAPQPGIRQGLLLVTLEIVCAGVRLELDWR